MDNAMIKNIIKLIVLFCLILIARSAFAVTGTVTSTYNIYDTEATYAAVRDSTQGSNDSSSGPKVGQTTAYRVYRGYLNVTIPALASCTSAYLYLYGDGDNSTTDFEIMAYLGQWSGTVSSAEWELWDGWTSGSAHTGTTFIDIGEWSTSSYVIGWNIIELNAAGRAAVLAAQGGTLMIALISKEDTDYDAPSNDEWVSFDGLGDEKAPYMRINDPIGGGSGSSSLEGASLEGAKIE